MAGRYVYNLDGLMKKTGILSASELQSMGYDVLGYIRRRKSEIKREEYFLSGMEQELTNNDEDEDVDEDDPDDEDYESDYDREYHYIGSFDIGSPNYVGT